MNKKVISIVLVLIMLGSLCACGAKTPTLTDINEETWCSNYIEALVSNKIAEGYEDGTFRATQYITCGEFVKLLARADGKPAEVFEARHWAYPYWEYLNSYDVFDNTNITGLRDALDTLVTRTDAAVAIYNMMINVRGEDVVAINNPAKNIPGYISLDKSALLPVAELYAKGILSGYDNLEFRGDDYLTRGQAAALIVKLYNDFAREVAEPMITGTYKSQGEFSENTLFIGDSLTYELVENYLKPYGMIGEASYMAVPCTTVKYFLAKYWVMTPSEDNCFGVSCNEEFNDLSFPEALAANKDQYKTVFFLLGSNGSSLVTKTQYINAIKLILDNNPGATIYIQTVPNCSNDTVDSDRVNSLIKEAVDYYHSDDCKYDGDKVVLLDTNRIWGAKEINEDGVHLTVEGLDAWYKYICKEIMD